MNAIYPISFLAVMILIGLAAGIQGTKLLRAFTTKYPKESQREIPYAFSRMRHPEKLLYFFRSKSLPLLSGDSELWKLRQRLKLLLLLLVVLPVLFFAVLVLLATIGPAMGCHTG